MTGDELPPPNAGDLMVYETMALYLRRRGEHAEADAMDALVAEVRRLRALGIELLDGYEDACHQGTGNKPLSSDGWHNFLSAFERADVLIPRAREALR